MTHGYIHIKIDVIMQHRGLSRTKLSQLAFLQRKQLNKLINFEIGEIREYYRIGEPRCDGHGCYLPSYNFAEDRPENGVSVVTTAWLNSFKSVFLILQMKIF